MASHLHWCRISIPKISINKGTVRKYIYSKYLVSCICFINHYLQLSRIMKTILDNRVKMPCFDPSDVLFLTNQWDCIDNEEHSSEEENEHTRTWKEIKNKLNNGWVKMKDDHLFQISLKQVSNMYILRVVFR